MTHQQYINTALSQQFKNVMVEQIGQSTDFAIIQNGERVGLFDACHMEFVGRVSEPLQNYIWEASRQYRDSL